MSPRKTLCVAFVFALSQAAAWPQAKPSPAAASAPTAVPALVPYSGVTVGAEGKPLTEQTSATFLIYADEAGGDPLFAETQAIAPDAAGKYTVQLGATLSAGLPASLFATGEARWLEVQIAGLAAQPRILLASVPYALKAADAATLGGLPASAYALKAADAKPAASPANLPNILTDVTTPGGVSGYVPVFNGATNVVDSPIFAFGSEVGIGTASPTATLDVSGTGIVTGALTVGGAATVNGGMTVTGSSTYNGPFALPAQGTATASGDFASQVIKVNTSAYNSATKAAVSPRFELQAFVTGQNTANPGATLDVLASTSTAAAVPTGFSINTSGIVSWAPGQTFPGAGVTGTVGAASYDLGGSLFATGSTSSGNAYVGFSGTAADSGIYNTALGDQALASNTANFNTATGVQALYYNTTGSYNTADGIGSLYDNTTGSFNTAVGAYSAEFGSGLTNTTAVGANAAVSQNNTLVLGNTTANNPGAEFVNVGVGTDTPRSILEASAQALNTLGPVLTLTNAINPYWPNPTQEIAYTSATAIDFNSYLPSTGGTYNPAARIEAIDTNIYCEGDGGGGFGQYFSDDLVFYTNSGAFQNPPGPNAGLRQNMIISAEGQVGIPSLQITGSPCTYAIGQLNVTGSGTPAIVATGNGADGGDFDGNSSGDGIQATTDGSGGYAGYFTGNVEVTGTLSAAVKHFQIDDPIDPANKYLVHSSVESSEMMNIYSGNVTTDELGLATVALPEWFEAENGDFRYQLTTIGRDAHAWIAAKVQNHQFKIATNATFVEVSWQITAVRQDAYAKANPLVVEQPKPDNEKGFYLNPEVYGQPAEKQTQWARRPQLMKRRNALLAQQKLQAQNGALPSAAPLGHAQPASAVNRPMAQVARPAIQPAKPSAAVQTPTASPRPQP
jgi:hypothetical protein